MGNGYVLGLIPQRLINNLWHFIAQIRDVRCSLTPRECGKCSPSSPSVDIGDMRT